MIDPLLLARWTVGPPPSIDPATRRVSVLPCTMRWSVLTDPDPDVASRVNTGAHRNLPPLGRHVEYRRRGCWKRPLEGERLGDGLSSCPEEHAEQECRHRGP